jgi:hypothetical protein
MQPDLVAALNHRMIGLDLGHVDHLVGVDVELAEQVIALVRFQVVDQPELSSIRATREIPARMDGHYVLRSRPLDQTVHLQFGLFGFITNAQYLDLDGSA